MIHVTANSLSSETVLSSSSRIWIGLWVFLLPCLVMAHVFYNITACLDVCCGQGFGFTVFHQCYYHSVEISMESETYLPTPHLSISRGHLLGILWPLSKKQMVSEDKRINRHQHPGESRSNAPRGAWQVAPRKGLKIKNAPSGWHWKSQGNSTQGNT